MRRLFALLAILFLSLSTTTLIRPTVLQAAPGDISVVSSTVEDKFPNEAIFHLEAKSSAAITKVTLYYKVGGSQTLSYAYPTITPGTSVSTQYSLNTQKTYIPPSSDINYQWQIDDSAGNSLRTDFQTFSYDDARFKWNNLTRERLTIYWYKGDQAFASDLLDAALASLKHLSSQIGITYEQPMKIVVYNSKADMDPALPKRSDTYSRETTTLGVRLSADVLALLGSQSGVKETLAHELTHMVVHQLVDNPYGDIPAWLDEGLAMVSEGDLPAGNQRALDDGVRRDDLLSIRSMTSYTGDANKVNLYYAESYSVVKYLLDTYGQDKMVQLLKVFKEGTAADDALRSVYGLITDELDTKWRASLGLGARPNNNNGSSTQPNATPVPTLVPFGTDRQAPARDLVRLLILICVPVALCTVVIVLVVVAFLVIRSRRS